MMTNKDFEGFAESEKMITNSFESLAKKALLANIIAVVVFLGGLAGIICLIAYLIKH